jgi:hypothetical protein
MLVRYFPNEFQMLPVAPIITGIISVFPFHMRCTHAVRPSYFQILSPSFSIIFLHPDTALSINRHVPFIINGDNDVGFIGRGGTVSFHLLIPE